MECVRFTNLTKQSQYLPDRIKFLSETSGLLVKVSKTIMGNHFNFYLPGDIGYATPVAGCYTYPKAKLFAQGVSLGRKL